MNLSFFGSTIDPTQHEKSQSVEHSEELAQTPLDDSLDEGDEYMDDALRMREQAFNLD